MSLDKHFCSSPWFHVRINNQGHYEFCRWASKGTARPSESVVTFFQKDMAAYRKQLIQGEQLAECAPCYEMEKHNKVSGRQKQLLKTGIRTDAFEHSFLSSPWLSEFATAESSNGETTLMPQDWQIDLGNYCNGGCVYCYPEFSTTLARDLKTIGVIKELPPNSWCNDSVKLARFIDDLCGAPQLQYLHFLGGETVIMPAFKTILTELVNRNLAESVTVGFTTNLTVWDQEIVDLLTKFNSVHVGLSVDCLTALNDYARWPSRIADVRTHIDRWVSISQKHDWLVQLRSTPTWLTVRDLTTIYDYAWDHNIIVESCNFLQNPAHLRLTVLPRDIRSRVADTFDTWLAAHPLELDDLVVNIRNPATARNLLHQDLLSYVNYLRTGPDESDLLPAAITYLKKLESIRLNSVLTHLPEYEDILRASGY